MAADDATHASIQNRQRRIALSGERRISGTLRDRERRAANPAEGTRQMWTLRNGYRKRDAKKKIIVAESSQQHREISQIIHGSITRLEPRDIIGLGLSRSDQPIVSRGAAIHPDVFEWLRVIYCNNDSHFVSMKLRIAAEPVIRLVKNQPQGWAAEIPAIMVNLNSRYIENIGALLAMAMLERLSFAQHPGVLDPLPDSSGRHESRAARIWEPIKVIKQVSDADAVAKWAGHNWVPGHVALSPHYPLHDPREVSKGKLAIARDACTYSFGDSSSEVSRRASHAST
ncbi:hypothetical protein IWW34DRAFT_838274 [Fusarium oxysporum f. sp. albedinis]|nr:hypothetical protein IWW34DRAFT_838274 [Fusarium oxysporum f. sp. albedinis]